MDKKVSIIVPCYNCEKYLKEALVSIEKQTYGNIEVICINDGSVDSTGEILDRYKNRSKREVYIHSQENSGVSSARNKGIACVTGEYIFFMDSDDCLFTYTIDELVAAISHNECDFAYGTWIDFQRKPNRELSSLDKKSEEQTGTDIFKTFMYRKKAVTFFVGLYRRSVIENNRIRFSEDLKYGEDNEFVWKYLSNIKQGYFVGYDVYRYRQTEDSAMSTIRWQQIDALEAVRRTGKYLTSRNYQLSREFYSYMPNRTLFSMARIFASGDNLDYYEQINKNYNLRFVGKALIGRNGVKLSIAAFVMAISPKLFYLIIRIASKIRHELGT